jgi:hypothetical protein
MDGKWGKPSTLITRPLPGVIERVEPVTNIKQDKLTSSSRPIELTLGDFFPIQSWGKPLGTSLHFEDGNQGKPYIL